MTDKLNSIAAAYEEKLLEAVQDGDWKALVEARKYLKDRGFSGAFEDDGKVKSLLSEVRRPVPFPVNEETG